MAIITNSTIHIGGMTFNSFQEMREYGRKNKPSWYHEGPSQSYQNVVIRNGVITIDGKPLNEYEEDQSKRPVFVLCVEGNVQDIKADSADIYVSGDAGTVDTHNGNVTCQGVKGNVHSHNGNIVCGKVDGDVNTYNGNIVRQ